MPSSTAGPPRMPGKAIASFVAIACAIAVVSRLFAGPLVNAHGKTHYECQHLLVQMLGEDFC